MGTSEERRENVQIVSTGTESDGGTRASMFNANLPQAARLPGSRVSSPAQFHRAQETRFALSRPAKVLKDALQEISNRWIRQVTSFMPDYLYLILSHWRGVGRFPNIKNPTTFNEMILDRCLNPDPRWSQLADKLGVRDYVRNKIGEKYLIPLIAAPDAFTQEVFDALPATFVMKANHGSGFVEIVRDKSKRSFAELREIANKWLGVDYYRVGRERHYRAIKPRIFFEQLLLDRTGVIPADFKMNVFGHSSDGPIIYTGIVYDRFGDARADVYDARWSTVDLAVGGYPRSRTPASPPAKWKEATGVAMRLAEGLGYVRVDLYVFGDDVYFGELTFTPGAGVTPFVPERYDYEWGRLFKATDTMRG